LPYLLLLVDGTSDATGASVPSERHFKSSKKSRGSENKYPAISTVVSVDQDLPSNPTCHGATSVPSLELHEDAGINWLPQWFCDAVTNITHPAVTKIS
jgi:hypothetical protein